MPSATKHRENQAVDCTSHPSAARHNPSNGRIKKPLNLKRQGEGESREGVGGKKREGNNERKKGEKKKEVKKGTENLKKHSTEM